MQALRRCLMIAGSVLVIICCAATSEAGRLGFPAPFTAVSSGEIVFSGTEEGGLEETLISCPMTLSGEYVAGTFESSNAIFGRVGLPIVGACTIGTLQGLLLEGADGRYSWESISILGDEAMHRPERINGLLGKIRDFSFLITRGLRRCLYKGDVGILIELRWEPTDRFWEEGAWTVLRRSTVALIARLGLGFCPSSGLLWVGSFSPVEPREWRPA